MRIASQDIVVTLDPLSYASGYKVLGGSVRQVYDINDSSFNPSRAMSPLVVLPWIASKDNAEHTGHEETREVYDEDTDTIEQQTVTVEDARLTGTCELSGVVYQLYRYRNGAWSMTVIGEDVSGDGLHVSNVVVDEEDADVPEAPKWSLVLKEDIPAEEKAYIHVIAYTVDKLDGMEKSQELDIDLLTDTVQEELLELKLGDEDVPTRMVIDPLRDGVSTLRRRVQLYRNGDAVLDSRAVYFWYWRTDGAWKLLTEDNALEHLWLKTSFDSYGNLPKVIEIDLDYLDVLNLMVRVAYWDEGGVQPTAPDDDRCPARVYYSLRRRLASETVGEVVTEEGIKVQPDTRIVRRLLLTDNQGELTSAQLAEHYVVEWWKVTSAVSTEQWVDSGELLTRDKASELGVTNSVSVSLHPRVFAKLCLKLVANGNGNLLVDGNGRYVLGRDCVRV